MNREIGAVEIRGNFEPERPAPAADDSAFQWLFASKRGYLEQISAYKAYARGAGNGDGRGPAE